MVRITDAADVRVYKVCHHELVRRGQDGGIAVQCPICLVHHDPKLGLPVGLVPFIMVKPTSTHRRLLVSTLGCTRTTAPSSVRIGRCAGVQDRGVNANLGGIV